MTRARTVVRSGVSVGFVVLTSLIVACDPEIAAPSSSLAELRQTFGKAVSTADMSVTSLSPDSATQDTTLNVEIAGGGFVVGTTATWSINGVADPSQIRTNSTTYVNSRKIVANITVSGTAAVGKWDVSVMASGKKGGIGTEMFTVKMRGNVDPNPAGTWKLPLADANLSLRSDRKYGDGTYSVYAAGTCNVTGTIFGSGLGTNDGGDATLQTSLPSKGKCGRLFTLVYPDGFSETLATFNNLHVLENSSFAIPIGATVRRRFTINPGNVINKTVPRCSRLQFGEFPTGGQGSDSVSVTRLDGSTWRVQSQPWPDDLAFCETNGQLYHMQVNFLVVASFPLR